jgi:hypothetical protein
LPGTRIVHRRSQERARDLELLLVPGLGEVAGGRHDVRVRFELQPATGRRDLVGEGFTFLGCCFRIEPGKSAVVAEMEIGEVEDEHGAWILRDRPP